jgi:hypothetical protein
MVIRLNTNVVPQISGNISTFNSLSQSVGEVVIPGPFSNNNWTGASRCVHLSPEQAQGFKFVTIYPRENQNGTDNYQMNAYLNNFQMTSLLIEGLPLEPLAFNCGISLPVELTTEFCGIEIGLGATTVRYTWIDVDGTTVISGADDPNPTTYFPSQSGVCTLRVEFYQFNQLVCFSDRHIEIIVSQPGTCCYLFGSPAQLVNYSSQTISGTTTLSAPFYIDGTMIISGNVTFDCPNGNCVVNMAPNAAIDILPGATLTITNGVTVAACQKMWHRIRVQGGATP